MTVQNVRGLSGWREIGFVEGAGTTTAPRSYRFSTDRLAPGTYRFRLIQVDEDGSEEMVGERQLVIQGAFDVISAPSPHPMRANTTVSLTTNQTETVRIVLYNTIGQQVAVIYDGVVRGRQPTTFTIPVDGSQTAFTSWTPRAKPSALPVRWSLGVEALGVEALGVGRWALTRAYRGSDARPAPP